MNKCLNCENDTTNPKFCSSSCSAKFNNSRKKPRTEESRRKTSATMKARGYRPYIRDHEKWKRSIQKTADRKKAERFEQIKTSPFDSLNYSEKRIRIAYDQGGTCDICKTPPLWNGLKLSFELDHINGDSNDNKRENLRMICPNCHSQTPTFRRKSGCRKDVTDTELLNELKTSDSIYSALEKLGIRGNGGNYMKARKIIRDHNLIGLM